MGDLELIDTEIVDTQIFQIMADGEVKICEPRTPTRNFWEPMLFLYPEVDYNLLFANFVPLRFVRNYFALKFIQKNRKSLCEFPC